MPTDPLLPLSVVEAMIRATAEGVSRGVLDACSAEAEAAAASPAEYGDGPQVWDGESPIYNSGGDLLGKLTGWKKDDQIIEIARFNSQASFESFLTATFRLSGHTTPATTPFDLIVDLEADYGASATRRWGLLVGNFESGLSAAAAKARWYTVASGVTWWKISQVIGGTSKTVGFLYRSVESGTAPARLFDQWFLSNLYAGPAESEVTVAPETTAPSTFEDAIAWVTGASSWKVQKLAWHVRPTA